ncbi:MAG: M23 family metallopeptidase [Acidobacteriia bacterium]|nr:M23 family metallopeptidase [Terriglobia bacterium]
MAELSSDRPRPRLAWALAAALLAATALGRGAPSRPAEERVDRLAVLQDEIVRLRAEMGTLGVREKGLLGEVAHLGAVLNLRAREAQWASLKLDGVRAGLAERRARIAALDAAQSSRRRALAARVREIYERGADVEARRLLGGGSVEAYLEGLHYASFLSQRDAKLLEGWREDGRRLREESGAMAEEERGLERVRTAATSAAAEFEKSRADRARLLEGIQADRAKHQEAIEELERAARELGKLVEAVGGEAHGPVLDVRKFFGLLDWPADGPISAAYGDSVHPRFHTVVRHPGLDIDSPEGASFRAVFDGRVVFASWLHGYGLTAIVDHGNDFVSVYAHASILLVAPGDDVTRGQVLGRVGDTGSLRGAYLYFETRNKGKPVDPLAWLRRR